MKIFNAFIAAVCLPMMTACLAAQTLGAWNHNPRSDAGPLRWGSVLPADATCGSAPDLTGKPIVAVGAKQTPINIEPAKTVPSQLPSLGFSYNPTALEVENTGHVVEVMYQAGSFLRIGTSPTDDYKLVQFHFHAPSEHTVDGKSYDAELHLVHTNMLGEIAVVGVLLNASANTKTGIYDDIVGLTPVTVSSASKESVQFNAKDLLPVSKSYYTYAGSLTTPPCTESVRWFVLETPVNVTDSMVRKLHSVIATFPGYDHYPNNNRPVVPTNGRQVLLVH